jgi:hypothetical protein
MFRNNTSSLEGLDLWKKGAIERNIDTPKDISTPFEPTYVTSRFLFDGNLLDY